MRELEIANRCVHQPFELIILVCSPSHWRHLYMNADNTSPGNRPAWVQELEQAFGGPSRAAFGTAVFFELLSDDMAGPDRGALEERALAWYQFFCGKTWEKFGPDNWWGTWRSVYVRDPNSAPVIEELANLENRQVRRSGLTMLEGHEDPPSAKRALEQAFDDSAIEELQIFRIGDGGAMSGILIAGRRAGGESAFVAFLLD